MALADGLGAALNLGHNQLLAGVMHRRQLHFGKTMSHFHPDASGEYFIKCDAPHPIRTEEPHFAVPRRVSLALSRLRGQTPVDYWLTHPLTPSEEALLNQEYSKELARSGPRHAEANIVHNPNVSADLFQQQMESCPVCQQSWPQQSGDLMTALSLTAFFRAQSGENPAR
jgi:hypothetical protein